jgi:hypothetical protein
LQYSFRHPQEVLRPGTPFRGRQLIKKICHILSPDRLFRRIPGGSADQGWHGPLLLLSSSGRSIAATWQDPRNPGSPVVVVSGRRGATRTAHLPDLLDACGEFRMPLSKREARRFSHSLFRVDCLGTLARSGYGDWLQR